MARTLFATLALAMVPLIPAAPAQAQRNVTEIRVCNHYHRRALVAASYIQVGDRFWRNRGWVGVPARGCATIGRTDNRHIYLYAEVQGTDAYSWGGNHRLCVEYPGPYNYFTDGRGETCRGNRRAAGFRHIVVEPGTFTWNLRP